LYHSVPSQTASTDLPVFLRPGTLAAIQSNLHLINRKKNLSVVGALSRSFSIPSVSGPSFQVCGYHIDQLISEKGEILSDNQIIKTRKESSMALSSSSSFLGDRGLVNSNSKMTHIGSSRSKTSSSTIYTNQSSDSYRKAHMSLNRKDKPDNHVSYGYFVYHVAKRRGVNNPTPGFGFLGFQNSSSANFSAGTAPNVSFENSIREEQGSGSADSSDEKIVAQRALKLHSGSCYLPHPDKEESGGEDAHFICSDEQAIGVADGVGGWADVGINAGIYAQQLMSNSVSAIQEEPKGSIDPARVLEKAYSTTKAKGSSTACIIALTDQGLHAINLGDSGFMVVRNGCTIFRSPVQQHDFNFTYQLENSSHGDMPSSGQVFTIPVAPGDVIIAGTDGLFDNLYNNDITAVVVHAIRAGFGPQVTAQKIAALARQRAQDTNRQTPFSAAAQDAGIRYYGGKLDDTTVVVSYITSNNENSKPLKSD
jgi:protein phosphatase PTC7